MLFDDYSFAGRMTATPGVCGALKRSARFRRALVYAAFRLLCSGDEELAFRYTVRANVLYVRLRRYRGGLIAYLDIGPNYRGTCWRQVDPATGIPGFPAFEIRRGTGELIGRDGALSLMPVV